MCVTTMTTEIINKWNSTTFDKLFIFDTTNRNEIVPYLQAIDEIQQKLLVSSNDQMTSKSHLVPIIVSRLTKEFHNILKVNSKSTPSSLNNNPNLNTQSTTMTDSAASNYEVYDDDVYVSRETMMKNECVVDLRNIVTRMHAFGFVKDCLKVYVNERKLVIDNEFERMKVEKLSEYSAKRLEWGVLEMKIEIWIKTMKICFNYCFEYEKRLCELIFHDLGEDSSLVDDCFMDVIMDYMKLLLDNAEALSSIRVAPERLFKILDVYDTLCSARPLMNNFFNRQGWEVLGSRAENEIVPKLGDKVREILFKFENSVVKEKSSFVCKEPVHQLAKYVMHNVYKLCDYKDTLTGIALSDLPSMDAVEMRSESLVLEGGNGFSVHIVWIVLSLISNLEVKASLIKDPLVSRFFLMNNFRYISQKVQGRPEMRERVGDENMNKLIQKFQRARDDYLKLSLEAVLRCLRDEGLNNTRRLPQRVSKLTERLKKFNAEFEKLQKDHRKSVVADFELMVELRKSIVEMVVVAYTNFLRHTENIPRLQTYIKSSAEEIESVIQEFFVYNPTR
uniref:exocyst complex component EXO70B1-like n=1 Tax=Erigeron canadensis TaxID=72917 RepID=UPI001CB8AB66|nr:exocyst complex component EXO70B1-like [Erigeron canadensis]